MVTEELAERRTRNSKDLEDISGELRAGLTNMVREGDGYQHQEAYGFFGETFQCKLTSL